MTVVNKKVFIKQGSTAPPLPIQIIAEDTNLPLDITNATATFSMRPDGSSTNTINAVAATIVDATNGKVYYYWGANDLATMGKYKAEFSVTFESGKIARFPSQGHIEVYVTDALDV